MQRIFRVFWIIQVLTCCYVMIFSALFMKFVGSLLDFFRVLPIIQKSQINDLTKIHIILGFGSHV